MADKNAVKDEVVNKVILLEAYKNALESKNRAEINFDNATEKYVNVAIYEYNAAQEKINIIIQELKEAGVQYGKIINV